jgi:hypothetical protein
MVKKKERKKSIRARFHPVFVVKPLLPTPSVVIPAKAHRYQLKKATF